MFGINEIYDELLNEARSPEEIRKILHYQFVDGRGVPESIFEKILSEDPTKKKTYTKWVLIQWENEQKNIVEALNNGALSRLFKYFQERAGSGLNLLGIDSFSKALSMVPSEVSDPIFNDDSDPNSPENNYKIVYDSNEWRVAVPNSLEASIKLGMGCKWCTAGAYGNPKRYYTDYKRRGELWINFDKRKSEIAPMDKREYPYVRYQFCFESDDFGELCDSENNRIDFIEMDMPEDVLSFYGEQNEEYVEMLELSGDSDRAIEARNERRLRNCIMRKSGDGGVDLLLLPRYADDNDELSMFLSSDLTDSIDLQTYTRDDIFDICDGFPMVIMNKNDGDDIYKQIYCERAMRRDTFNGPNIYYTWDSIESYIFGGNENMRYFWEYFLDFLYILNGPSVNDVTMLNLRDYSYDTITELKFDNLPDEYRDKIWFQGKFDTGQYNLFYIDGADVKYVINEDFPPKGSDAFDVVVENGEFVIKGILNDYKLSTTGNTNNEKMVLKPLEVISDGDFVIVSYDDENSPRLEYCGLYEPSTKNLLIKDALDIEEDGGCLLVSYPNFKVFYDYENKREVSKRGTNFNRGNYGMYTYKSIEDGKTRIFSSYEMNDCGPFERVYSFISYSYALVNYNGANVVVNADNGTFPLPKGSVYEDMEGEDLLKYSFNGKQYIFDCSLGGTIAEIAVGSSLIDFSKKAGINNLFVFTMPNGKQNILTRGIMFYNYSGHVLFDNGVDKIIPAINQNGFNNIVAFELNNKVFFGYIKRDNFLIKPTKRGINADSFVKYKIFETSGGELKDLLILVKVNGRLLTVVFSSLNNTISGVYPSDGKSKEISSEDLSAVEKLFFPDKVQISEDFKSIVDRMNNL